MVNESIQERAVLRQHRPSPSSAHRWAAIAKQMSINRQPKELWNERTTYSEFF